MVRARVFFALAATCSTALDLVGCVGYLDVDAGAADAGDDGGADGCSYGAYACKVLEGMPVVYLRFDEDGGLTAKDWSGNHHDGTYNIAGTTLGVQGALGSDPDTAVHLDGTTGITMPTMVADFAQPNPEFTVELWINADADGGDLASGSTGFLIDHQTEGMKSPTNGWSLILTNGSVQLLFWASSMTLGVPTMIPQRLVPSAWHQVVGVATTNEQYLFIDTVNQTPHNAPLAGSWPPIGPWMIGNENCSCSAQGFTGSIDELAIYPRPLSQSEIQKHYLLATQ